MMGIGQYGFVVYHIVQRCLAVKPNAKLDLSTIITNEKWKTPFESLHYSGNCTRISLNGAWRVRLVKVRSGPTYVNRKVVQRGAEFRCEKGASEFPTFSQRVENNSSLPSKGAADLDIEELKLG